ncbi:hypothetical protein BH09PAT1_BH09PAT1_2970 [soil metagenome]
MKKVVIHYNSSLKEKARYLRNNSTVTEVLIWQQLKEKRLGYDFDRQKPIGNYIVDFYCSELALAIEIDGITHSYKYEYDLVRDQMLQELG